MTRQQQMLFMDGDLRGTLEHFGRVLAGEVEQAPEEHVLQVDEDEWVRALVERYTVEAPVLLPDQMWMDQPTEVQVDVSWDIRTRFIRDPNRPAYVHGYRTIAHIPFTGAHNVFLLRPSQRMLTALHADVTDDELQVRIEYPHDRLANITAETQQLVNRVEQHLEWARGDIEQYNSALEATARRAIQARRERLQRHYEHLAATGLPIGPRAQTSKTYVADVIVRRPAPRLASLTAEQPMPLEPVLADEVFEHILRVIRETGLGMERSPQTYATMGEEDRRQVLLNNLNTHYGGKGTAEAFNLNGDTDILIRYENANLFIGECKFWSGQKGFIEAVDQLFGYRAWRDTKLAVVMFVRERDLTTIIERAQAALAEHPQFVEWQQAANETELRATVSWPGDERRHADLNVFFIHTPAE